MSFLPPFSSVACNVSYFTMSLKLIQRGNPTFLPSHCLLPQRLSSHFSRCSLHRPKATLWPQVYLWTYILLSLWSHISIAPATLLRVSGSENGWSVSPSHWYIRCGVFWAVSHGCYFEVEQQTASSLLWRLPTIFRSVSVGDFLWPLLCAPGKSLAGTQKGIPQTSSLHFGSRLMSAHTRFQPQNVSNCKNVHLKVSDWESACGSSLVLLTTARGTDSHSSPFVIDYSEV